MREAVECAPRAARRVGRSCSTATSRSARPGRLSRRRSSPAAAGSSGSRPTRWLGGREQPRRRDSPGRWSLLADASGRVIVSGVGKSGLIARKIAATLTSTGTRRHLPAPGRQAAWRPGPGGPPRRRHRAQQERRDRGAVRPGRAHWSACRCRSSRSPAPSASTLARAAAVSLDGGVEEEACPHDLAPTTSTTVALALGDALAVALLELKRVLAGRTSRRCIPAARSAGSCCSGCAT